MANALKDQFADPQFQSMAFEDRLGLLVDAEWNARKNNHLNKLIRQATFSDPGACLENVEYLPDRGLKQEELLRFGTCNYIQEHHNIILLGATGSGKTYLACALGMAAARRFYAAKYIRLPDLLVRLLGVVTHFQVLSVLSHKRELLNWWAMSLWTHDKIPKAIGAEHIQFHDLRYAFAALSLKNRRWT